MTLIKPFNNRGDGQNIAGVCEAAVCRWLMIIRTKVKLNLLNEHCFYHVRYTQYMPYTQSGEKFARHIPTTKEANDLYTKFDNGEYPLRFVSYLEKLFSSDIAGNSRPSDARRATTFGCKCSHYSGELLAGNSEGWYELIDDMHNHDVLFLNLQHNNDDGNFREGHAVGVYKAGGKVWIFDPLTGLHEFHHKPRTDAGLTDDSRPRGSTPSIPSFERGVKTLSEDDAINYICMLTLRWNTCLYYGLHLAPVARFFANLP